ncbi:MAG: alpha-glucan family phosphorylase [Deltaproteobacteria bacterium]
MTLRKYVVVPPMEGELEDLREIAGNLWFSWHTEAVELFDHLDERLWDELNHNPQQVLIRLSRRRINEIRQDEGYRSHTEKVHQRFRAYMEAQRTYDYRLPRPVDFITAYFSLEFGLTECLPLYSGGLGVLAGDHLKSASDLSLSMVGVGLMYHEGYFRQRLSAEGWQEEVYPRVELDTLPLERMTDSSGRPLRISVDLAGETLWARVLKASIGRVAVYLLDSDDPENRPFLRNTTARLHGGDAETRIRQEILLGVGGCRALNALGIEPLVYHLNEGHAAFILLERMRYFVQEQGLSLEEAREMVTSQSLLTIHSMGTPEDEAFERPLLEKYFRGLVSSLGMDFEIFLNMGRKQAGDQSERLCMPVLALRTTAHANAVSKLHAQTARLQWRGLWPKTDVADVPIVPITNGVHIPSYISRDLATLYERYLGPGWNEDPEQEKMWLRAEKIPDSELWRTHERCRSRLVYFARKRLKRQLERREAPTRELDWAGRVLDPEVLTVCFGGGFEPYKRASLLFKETDRLAEILSHSDRPVQLIFAGKAHPADHAGMEEIRSIVQLMKQEPFRSRLAFIEDYDLNVARTMVQGADVWVNTPRRPLESCGTAGMKAAANGALNLGILDGWWDEAYQGDNGWAIGWGEEYDDPAYQDDVESRALYDLLESSVAPLFYEKGVDDLPREWINMMKRSIITLCPIFNSHRMVSQYVEDFYVPAANNSLQLRQEGYKVLRDLVVWKRKIAQDWPNIAIVNVEVRNQDRAVKGREAELIVSVETAGHLPDELTVEVVHGPLDQWDNFKVRYITRLSPWNAESPDAGTVEFGGLIPLTSTGLYGYEVRITPAHPNLPFSQRFELMHRA